MKIGSTTKNFLRQLRQRSQTLDKAASEEAVDRVSTEERVSSQARTVNEPSRSFHSARRRHLLAFSQSRIY